MMTRTGLTITVIIALAFVVGIAVWAWRVLAPTDAEGNRQQFSFAQLLGNDNNKMPTISETPQRISERMPDTPAEIAPPQLLGQGKFETVSETRPSAGQALLFRLGTGEYLLRVEEFSVVKGPGLHVYLTGAGAAREADTVLRDFIDLGAIKAQQGDHNYLMPADIDLSDYDGVVVFSPFFREIYATAQLNESR
jgi:hypothetical protein